MAVQSLTLKTSDLIDLVRPIVDLPPSKSPLESMRCVHFRSTDKEVVASARDATTSAWSILKVLGRGDSTFSLYADVLKKIVGIAQQSKAPDVRFDIGDVAISILIGTRAYTIKRPVASAPDTPPDKSWHPVPVVFPYVLRSVAKAMSTDPSASALNGVFFDPAGKVVALDGPRMHVYEIDHGIKEAVVAPASWVNFVASKLEMPDICLADGVFYASTVDLIATAPAITSQYPSYENLIPDPLPNAVAIVKADDLRRATEEAVAICDTPSPAVKLSFADLLAVSAAGTSNEGVVLTEVTYPTKTRPVAVKLKASYLIDALGCFSNSDEQVVIGHEQGDPGVVLRTVNGNVRAVVGVTS